MRISDIVFFLSEKIKTDGDLKTEGIEIYSYGSYKYELADEVLKSSRDTEGLKWTS